MSLLDPITTAIGFSRAGGPAVAKVTGQFDPRQNSVASGLADATHMEEERRRSRVVRALRLYHGEHPRTFKPIPGQPDDNVTLNYARIGVDKTVSALFGDLVKVKIDDENAEAEWTRIEDASGGSLLWQRLAMSGSIGGDAWLRIVTPPLGWPAKVRIVVPDATCMSASWEPDDHELPTEYRNQWVAAANGTAIAKRQRVTLDGSQWIITDEQSYSTDWQKDGWIVTAQSVWPFPWSPILHAQHLPAPSEFYGVSDLEMDGQRLLRQINAATSNIQRILRLYAHPTPWSAGAGDMSAVTFTPGKLIQLPTTDGKLNFLEFHSDLKAAFEQYKTLRDAFLTMIRIPAVALGETTNIDLRSGAAIRQAYAPLVDKTETLRRTYGALMVATVVRALDMSGVKIAPQQVHIEWPELLPSDALTEAETLLVHKNLGVSDETLVEKAGYDWETELTQNEDAATRVGHNPFDVPPPAAVIPPLHPRATSL